MAEGEGEAPSPVPPGEQQLAVVAERKTRVAEEAATWRGQGMPGRSAAGAEAPPV